MNRPKPAYLLRTSESQYIMDLLNLGKVYMKSLSYYADEKTHNSAKDDRNEGRWLDSGYVWIGAESNKFRVENVRHSGYIYCFTGFEDNIFNKEHPYRFRNQTDSDRLGDKTILIWNPKEFNRRLVEALKKRGFQVQSDWVSYDVVSEDQYKTGELLSPFHKSKDDYNWEGEFRFFVPSTCVEDHLEEELGPLNDIACIMEKGMRYDLIHMHDHVFEVFSSFDV